MVPQNKHTGNEGGPPAAALLVIAVGPLLSTRSAKVMNNFSGIWFIEDMGAWDQTFVNMEVRGHFTFDGSSSGHFQFGLVRGELDCRFEQNPPRVDFTFEGSDEMNPTSGRGHAVIEDGELTGEIFFHDGDDSTFRAVRSEAGAGSRVKFR